MRWITSLTLFLVFSGSAGCGSSVPPPAGAGSVAPSGIDCNEGFAAVDAAWIKDVQRVVPTADGGSFTPVGAAQGNIVRFIKAPRWHPEGESSIDTYYRSPADQKAGIVCRSIWRDGKGRVFCEDAGDGAHSFERGFYEDGSVNSYRHYAKSALITACSISPDAKTRVEVRDGRGTSIVWSHDGDYEELAWFAGQAYVARIFKKGEVAETTLLLENDHLRHEAESEELETHDELWNKTAGQLPRAEIMDEYIDGATGNIKKQDIVEDDIKRRIRMAYPEEIFSNGWPDPKGDAARAAAQKALVGDYASRRAEFVERFSRQLQEAGRTWEEFSGLRAGIQ